VERREVPLAEHTVLAADRRSHELAAADADGDRLLDIYACRWRGTSSVSPAPYWNAQNGAPDVYWHNDGGHQFSDRTKEAGLETHTTRFGLAVVWEDLDEDGQIDLYVVNDFGKNCFYKNDHGKFTEIGEAAGASVPAAGMGVSVDDVDHDGNLDLFLTNMDSAPGMRITTQPRFLAEQPDLREHYRRHSMGNTLLLATDTGTSRRVAQGRCLRGGWSWGGMFFDLQNDGGPTSTSRTASRRAAARPISRRNCAFVVNRSPRATAPGASPPENYLNAWDALGTSLRRRDVERSRAEPTYLNLGGAT
jgi:hypothetical protein